MIRVLLVDDYEPLLTSLVRLLARDPSIEVIGTAATARDGIELARSHHPDVVVMDQHLPDMKGTAATRILLQVCPGVRVVALTGSEQTGAAWDALEAGSSAWVRKTRAVLDLTETIHNVHAQTEPPQQDPPRTPLAGSHGRSC